MMGISRTFYSKYGEKIDLDSFMTVSSAVCVATYLVASLSPSPALSLLGCALTGLTVGIMWPGSFSRAASALRRGGTAMFALLALAGDLGCSAGPSLVGFVSDRFGDNLKLGILAAVIFPLTMTAALIIMKKHLKKTSENADSALDIR